MTDYLCSYKPLCITPEGRQVGWTPGRDRPIYPFLDHSCRREPDFSASSPTITSLCRGNKLAPKLRVGDRVVYMSVKADYGWGVRQRYLVACLRVTKRFETHELAAAWYRRHAIELPCNCVVDGNPPLPSSLTAYPDQASCTWDGVYQYRAKHWGAFLICEAEEMNLQGRLLSDETLKSIFGRIPVTRSYWLIRQPSQYAQLRQLLET